MSISPRSILDQMKNIPLTQQKAIERSIIGIDIEWKVNLFSVEIENNKFEVLSSTIGVPTFFVSFSVPLNGNENLKLIKINEEAIVKGKISNLYGRQIELSSCVITIINKEKNREESIKINNNKQISGDKSITKELIVETDEKNNIWNKKVDKKWLIGSVIIPILALIVTLAITNEQKYEIKDTNFIEQNNENGINIAQNNENAVNNVVVGTQVINDFNKKLRKLETLETGLAVDQLPPNVYFYSNSTFLTFYYDDLPNLITYGKKCNSCFLMQKFDKEVILLGYLNSENFSKASSVNDNNPMSLILFPSSWNEFNNLIGIPLNKISAINSRDIDVDDGYITILDIEANELITDVEYYD